MIVDAGLLLSGPRGRRLCLEYALARGERSRLPAEREAASTIWWAARAYDPYPGVILSMTDGDEAPPAEPPTPSAAEAAGALDSLALAEPTAAELRDALAKSVGAAMYWQAPDGRDGLCATREMTGALLRVAQFVIAAPPADWWASPVAADDQWSVPWDGGGRPPADLDRELHRWRDATAADDEQAARERPADPTAAWSGNWWSIPPATLIRSTRSLGADGPAGLWFVEDSHGDHDATATPLDTHVARVIEIDGPEDWADLCRRHPFDVSASRRHDWYRVTGRDGRWTLPDWSAVAAEADAVHLSVAGYLSAATRLIEVDGDRASVLAGWNPDETYWFRGVTARPADAQHWRRDDDVWRRADG